MEKIAQLKARLREIGNIRAAVAVLNWDQQVYMPPGGATTRAAQLETLSKIRHEMFTAEETGRLLEEAEVEGADLDYDGDDASLLRAARRDYDQATKLPVDLVAEQASTSALAQTEWITARTNNDYATFAPWLEKQLDLARRRADYLGYEDCMYDALLDLFEPDMKTAQVAKVFDQLKTEQIAIVRAIAEQADSVDESVLGGDFPEAQQYDFIMEIVPLLGYDLERGRLDTAVHPFCSSSSQDDVRITTRYNLNRLNAALFGSMHETGHALYEQGTDKTLFGTLLDDGTSLGVHESQSRLWENIVGRSRGFWRRFYPRLQEVFPNPFANVELEAFYRAINRVQPSLIRVEADEVTYNLHIIIRFEMENDLLEGKLSVADAPAAWNARYEEYLGLTPETDTLGILQDVHWSAGYIGYFPTYALGNLLSVQFYNKAVEENPDIPAQIENGEFGDLLAWMQTKIYTHGRKYLPTELIERVAGGAMDAGPYLAYLRQKYGDIYAL